MNSEASASAPRWKVVPEETHDHWLELVEAHPLNKDKPLLAVSVRFDGCIHIWESSERDVRLAETRAACYRGDGGSYQHICELDDFIQRLQEISERAKQHFGASWPR